MAQPTADEITEFEKKMVRRRTNLVTFVLILYFLPVILTLIFVPQHWLTFVVVYGIYILLSIQIVKQDEVGTIIFLGTPSWEVRNGPAIVPPPFCWLRKDPGVQIKLRIGTPLTTTKGEAVKVEDNHDTKYYVNTDPMRVTFATPESSKNDILRLPNGPEIEKIPDEKNDPLSQRLTPDPNLLLIWKIENHPRFLEEIGTVHAANELLLESGSSGLAIIAGQITPAMAIRHQDMVERLITERIEIRVGEYDHDSAKKTTPDGKTEPRFIWLGIDFMTAQITSWGLPRDVNQAQAKARAEGFAKEGVIEKAEGEKQKRIREGAGTAEARNLLLQAEATGAKALADAINTEEGVIITMMQTIRDALKEADYAIVPGSGNLLSPEGLISAAAGIDEALKRLRQTKVVKSNVTDGGNPPPV